MCGSACLPGGGAGSPDLPLISPPTKVDQEFRPSPCEAAGGHLAGEVRALSIAELPDLEAQPARVWCPRPPAPGNECFRLSPQASNKRKSLPHRRMKTTLETTQMPIS